MAKVEKQTYALICTVCKNKNYYAQRNKKRKPKKKLELKKYCKVCKKHTLHREGK